MKNITADNGIVNWEGPRYNNPLERAKAISDAYRRPVKEKKPTKKKEKKTVDYFINLFGG